MRDTHAEMEFEFEPRALGVYASALLCEHAVSGSGAESFCGSLLFVDIVDSTGLTDRFAAMGPDGSEQLAGLFNEYFGFVFAAIAEHEGDVIGMDGDSVLALWREDAAGSVAASRALQLWLGAGRRDTAALIQQRIVVTEGRLTTIPIEPAPDRRLLVLAGEPLRAIGTQLARCKPGQTLLPDRLWAEPGALSRRHLAQRRHFDCSDAALIPYLPRAIASRLTTGLHEPMAEFRTVTSVMIRLDGLEEDTGTRLVEAVAAIQDELTRLRLTVDDLQIGDKGTVVRFLTGLPPYSMESNAAGAVEAAARVLDGLSRCGVPAGIGVATGRTFVGEVGNAGRRALATIGPVMSRAARLMQAAQGEILCDPVSVIEAGERFTFAAPVAMLLKGNPTAVPVRRLVGRGHQPKPIRSPRAMFGRDAELRTVSSCLDRMSAGVGGLVLIEAEPGGGKSRLLAQSLDLARLHRHVTLFSAAQAVEEQTAYFAFRQILAQMLGAEPGWDLDPAQMSMRICELLEGDALLSRAEVLADVLSVDAAPFASWPRLTGAARPGAILDVVARLLHQDGIRPPPVLFIDDAQWLDASSIRLLSGVVRRLPGMLVILASRPMDATTAAELRGLCGGRCIRLALARLDRNSTGELVRATLRGVPVPRRLVDLVHDRSEGLPLHAEQLVLAMLERGLIRLSPQGARVEVDFTQDPPIETLRDVIVHRVDLLPPGQQELLRVASVLGRSFEPELLVSIHPGRPERPWIEAQLAALEQSGLLGSEGPVIAFRHVRIRDVIYDLLPFQRRRALHRAAALAMETMYADDITVHCGQLATHWELAKEAIRGAAFRLRAATHAMERHATNEQLAHLGMVEQNGGSAALFATDAERAEFARLYGLGLEELGHFAPARIWLERCAELSGITVRRGRSRIAMGALRELVGQLRLRASLPTLFRSQDKTRDALCAQLSLRFAEHAYYAGDNARLLEVTLTALNCAERAGTARDLVTASGSFALGLGVAGLHRLARFYGTRAMRIGRSAHPWYYGMAHLLNAVRLFAVADWSEMEAMTASGASIFQELGERDRYASCRLMTAYARIAQGDLVGAQALVDEFGQQGEHIDNAAMRDFAVIARSLIDLFRGHAVHEVAPRLSAIGGERLSSGEIVLCRGIEAAAALAAGDLAHARSAADLTLAMMERQFPSISIAYFGVMAMTATYRVLAASAPADPVAGRQAARALKLLRGFARRMPVARPYAEWLTGQTALDRGSPHRAIPLLQHALQTATRLGTPLEAALCHRALAAAGDGSGGHEAAADAILDRIGTIAWMDPVGKVSASSMLGFE